MLKPHPLTSNPTPSSAWVLSASTCTELYSYERHQPVGPSWVCPVLSKGKSSILSISPTHYTHFIRDGAIFSATQKPDGSVISLERNVPGPLSCWEFANHDDFLNRRGTPRETEIERVINVGGTLFARRARTAPYNRHEATELVTWRAEAWEPLGVFGENIADLHAITDNTLWFDGALYRWYDAKLTHLTDAKKSYCENISAHIGDTTFILTGRGLCKLNEDGTIAPVGWTVTNLMGIWAAGGLLFVRVGDNKRSWIAALYDPATGKTRGFKRKDFGLERYQNSNQWIVAHGRLFFLTGNMHFEVDLKAVSALRRTRLKS